MKKNKKKQKFYFKVLVGLVLTAFLTSVFFLIGGMPFLYRTSVLHIPEHAPFDGTTYPVKKVPNWSKLGASRWNLKYDQYKSSELVDIPSYDPKQLKGSGTDVTTRNAKTTYPVPYMANYMLQGLEYSGSHPAVDIKIPEGTPIYAIANGTVTVASTQTSGFGKHIVLQHNNFPSLDDENAKTTLFSSYNHLSSLLVDNYQVVRKGELIGYSGMTGTATTPHLHFQIDNEDAPFHPFWPFTTQDMKDAGLDFFSAINAGLGKEKAEAVTINPMKYVQRYIGGDAMYIADENNNQDDNGGSDNTGTSYVDNSSNNSDQGGDDTSSNSDTSTTDTSSTDNSSVDNSTTDSTDNQDAEPAFDSFGINVDSKYYVDADGEFTITIQDQNGHRFTDGFSGDIIVTAENDKVVIDKAILTSTQFTEGAYVGQLKGVEEGTDRLKITYDDKEYSSDKFEVSAETKEVSFTDVSSGNKYHDSIMYLASKGVVKGYTDGTFKPTKSVSRAEAIKVVLEGTDMNVANGSVHFKDVKNDDWYVRYLYTAQKKNIIQGYGDKTFKPGNTVSKAEFLKILFTAMKIKVTGPVKEAPYNDVQVDSWYAPYFAKAKDLGVLDDVSKISPSNPMTRQEVADIIYRVMTAVNA